MKRQRNEGRTLLPFVLLLLAATTDQVVAAARTSNNQQENNNNSKYAFDVVATVNHDYIPVNNNVVVYYDCQVINRWTARSHPIDYPEGLAYWSAPVLLSHNDHYQLWKEGDTNAVSPGIVQLTEEGSNGILLQDELSKQEQEQNVLHHVVGIDLPLFSDKRSTQTLEGLQVDQHHPYISSIAKFGPSPNWFSGFTNFSPIHADSNIWMDQFILDTYPFDEGSMNIVNEDGDIEQVTYLDQDGKEQEGSSMFISRITESHFPSSGALLDPTMTHVKPVARWDCERLINHGDDGSASANLRPTPLDTTGSPHALMHEINDSERYPGLYYKDKDDDDNASSANTGMAPSFFASTAMLVTLAVLSF